MEILDWAALSRLVPELAIMVLFIWYNQNESRAWREFLARQSAEMIAAISKLSERMDTMNAVLIHHDASAAQAINRIMNSDEE